MRYFIASLHSVLACTFALCFASQVSSGTSDKISPQLAELWKQSGDSEVTVIAYLHDRAEIASLDQYLTKSRATRQLRHQLVIDELRRVAQESQSRLLTELNALRQQGSIEGFTPYWIVNAIVIRGDSSAVSWLANQPEVEWVEESFSAELIEPVDRSSVSHALDENHGVPTGIRAIGAPRVWYELGFTGAGRIVGNIDTGVDGAHPALAARWRGTTAPVAECWLDVVGITTFPHDNSSNGGHGTHVMGTICGNSTTSNDSVGVAPQAQWIACNGINQQSGGGFNNDILDAFQWLSDPDGNSVTVDDVPDVVQNSWGVDGRFGGYTDCFQLWNDAIVNCEAAGVVVTFSAGNEGSSPRTLRSPATIQLDSVTVFSIGAVNANSDTIPPYTVASFSSRGPTDCPPFLAIKPEVCAPGVDVYSSYPGNNYIRLSGTSMAGPHVAGIVALMREANPNAEVREIKSILMRTAHDYGTEGEDNDYGFGFVDAYEAVLAISLNRAIVSGIVRDAVSEAIIPNALVRAGTRQRVTNADGEYALSLPGDSTWQLICSRYGYAAETLEVTVAAAETLIVDFALTPVPQGRISGTLTAGEAVPVRGATIAFPGLPLVPLNSNNEGRFLVDLPGDSSYTLLITYDGAVAETTVALPTGEEVILNIHLHSAKSQAQGPDNYGYRAFDQLDSLIPPTYDWIEIAPSRFGAGTLLTLENRDSSAYIAMPFPFRYYGQVYDSLTINENGWLAAGISHDHSYFNFQIPGASGPAAGISLFWDNLQWVPDSSELCYYYSPELDRVIIEYLDFRFLPGGAGRINCQLQILNPESWVTPTGDADILMLYERVDVPNSSSIGIENASETVGIQCLYNGSYGNRTWSVRPPWAVLFTTRLEPYPSTAPEHSSIPQRFEVSDVFPNPFNASAELTVSIAQNSRLEVSVYDVLGRKVETLLNKPVGAGEHRVLWSPASRPSGLYFFRIQSGREIAVRKAILLK